MKHKYKISLNKTATFYDSPFKANNLSHIEIYVLCFIHENYIMFFILPLNYKGLSVCIVSSLAYMVK